MIKDTVKNAKYYFELSDGIKKGLEFLQTTDLKNISEGKHLIENNDIYVNIQNYDTISVEKGRFEAHKKYIDIQYIITGEEQILVCPMEELSTKDSYNEERDVEFFKNNDKNSSLILKEGDFAIFYPQDAHMPMLNVEFSKKVKKAVVKIKIK